MRDLSQTTDPLYIPFSGSGYPECVFERPFSRANPPCGAKKLAYWVDYSSILATTAFPDLSLQFIHNSPVSSAHLELEYVVNSSRAAVTPFYMSYFPERIDYGLRFLGPVLFSQLTMVYRSDILDGPKSLNASNLAILATIALLICLTKLLRVVTAQRTKWERRVPWVSQLHKCLGVFAGFLETCSLTLVEGYLIIFFTNSFTTKLPLTSQVSVVSRAMNWIVRREGTGTCIRSTRDQFTLHISFFEAFEFCEKLISRNTYWLLIKGREFVWSRTPVHL